MKNVDNGYELLATAIIKQAADDYMEARKRLYTDDYFDLHEKKKLIGTIDECTRFFLKSEWFTVLTDVHGDAVLKELDKQFDIWAKEEDLGLHKKKQQKRKAELA